MQSTKAWGQLEQKYPRLLGNQDKSIKVTPEQGKSGLATLVIEDGPRPTYLHSKYDPIREAESLITSYEAELENPANKTVICFGIGLGYHIDVLTTRYPDKQLLLIEPLAETLPFLKERNVAWDIANIDAFTVGTSEESFREFTSRVVTFLQTSMTVIVPATYKTRFMTDIARLQEMLVKGIKAKRANVRTTAAFQDKWLYNACANINETLHSEPFITTDRVQAVKGKPVIIVSAGPSLSRDLDTLRHIQETNAAFLLSVGSAINILIDANIKPDAVLTYDPLEHSNKVFKKAVETGWDRDIPMVFGTTVFPDVVGNYRGQKYHVVSSQDTITKHFLLDEKTFVVRDAPSIAVIALQLAIALSAGKIIFAGQNLSYMNGSRYAEGVPYGSKPREDIVLPTVKNVFNEEVTTENAYLMMKQSMETIIYHAPESIRFINTTFAGAAIDGADYQSLQEVAQTLQSSTCKELFKDSSSLHIEETNMTKENNVLQAYKRLSKQLETAQELVEQVARATERVSGARLGKQVNGLQKAVKKWMNVPLYEDLFYPFLSIQTEHLRKNLESIVTIDNEHERALMMVKAYRAFVEAGLQARQSIEPSIKALASNLEEDR